MRLLNVIVIVPTADVTMRLLNIIVIALTAEKLLVYFFEEISTQQHDCWPLDLETKSVIMKNYSEIADLLEVDEDLVCEMLSQECFTLNQLIIIYNTRDECERNQKLLNSLLRGSTVTWTKFIGCLQRTQRHILPLITGNTGKMDVNTWLKSEWI